MACLPERFWAHSSHLRLSLVANTHHYPVEVASDNTISDRSMYGDTFELLRIKIPSLERDAQMVVAACRLRIIAKHSMLHSRTGQCRSNRLPMFANR
jgi:hypothetical protein